MDQRKFKISIDFIQNLRDLQSERANKKSEYIYRHFFKERKEFLECK